METKYRTFKKGDPPSENLKPIQKILNDLGSGPILVDGIFGNETRRAVKHFQSTHCDGQGHPLVIDGIVGVETLASLFEMEIPPVMTDSELAATVLKIAADELGICEDPPGSNRGERVNEYLHSVGVAPGAAWCAAFVFWCFMMACLRLGVPNPLPRTGGCMQLWKRSAGHRITLKEARENPGLVVPGMIFVISRGDGKGHCGLVAGMGPGYIKTIEGNANNTRSSEGMRVCSLQRRISTINCGFIKYS